MNNNYTYVRIGKGRKLKAGEFDAITGWQGRSTTERPKPDRELLL